MLGAWTHVQTLSNGIHLLASHSSSICCILVSAMTHSSSAISHQLEECKAPAWHHGWTQLANHSLLDKVTGQAVDTFNNLFHMCKPDIQQAVLNAVSKIVKAGALWEKYESLHAAVRFYGRHFHINGINQGTCMPKPICPRLDGHLVLEEVLTAAVSMSWVCESGYVSCRGPHLFSDLLHHNQSMWTVEILVQALNCSMIFLAVEWPALLTPTVSSDWYSNVIPRVAKSPFEDSDFTEVLEFMHSIIMPHMSKPWDFPHDGKQKWADGWCASKECQNLESLVMLAALEAGLLRFSIRAYACRIMHGYASEFLQHLTGSTSDGLATLNHLRASGSWPKAMHHLVEAAQQLTDNALAQPLKLIDPNDVGDDEQLENDILRHSQSHRDSMEAWSNPWLDYQVVDAVKFLAEVSATHQQELMKFDPNNPNSSPLNGVEKDLTRSLNSAQSASLTHAMLSALHSSIQKVVTHISEAMKDGDLTSAMYAAHIIMALLGGYMPSNDNLNFNASLLLASGAIKNICLHLQPLSTTTSNPRFSQLVMVLSLLARRHPEARGRLISMRILPVLLKRVKDNPWEAVEVFELLGTLTWSEEVHSSMKQAGVPQAVREILQVYFHLCFLGVLIWVVSHICKIIIHQMSIKIVVRFV